ncbi:MAG: OsmC family protein [Anaerolineae bacterium]|nr:OsmC family protein [Anaerolineae bacterium]
MTAILNWKGEGLKFAATANTGGEVGLASGQDEGEPGFRPMEMMAIGLGGCTAMDVLSILKKKRQDVTAFEVQVHTEVVDQHPRVWNQVTIEYLVTGNNIDPDAVERAMALSYDKYCPAQNMIRKAVDINLTYKIIEAASS